ncbi:hypothetical protein [Leptolyngbya sp. PCC 6406]|uniref:hypothetical protein n=1 Tax=Leptolyngbya sp. PCC 6406 TaxID=1173264 RepID=UPI0002ACE615|nr:hypothetical protein [Leptolyngbya sp. PCC 6406]
MTRLNWKAGIATVMGAIAVLGSAGLAQAQSRMDWLSSGESVTYEGYLFTDENVYGICDDNCSDLDIYLYDAGSGELVSSDTLVDNLPIVTAPYEGNFLIQVVMVDCLASACETATDSDTGF